MTAKKILANLVTSSILVTSMVQYMPVASVYGAQGQGAVPVSRVQEAASDVKDSSEILSGLTPGVDYEEGAVILLAKDGAQEARLGGVKGSLLESAEVLSDVTEAVADDEEYPEQVTGEEAALGAEDKVTLSLVRSDEYTTGELLDMYKDIPGVLDVMPNYISHVDDEWTDGIFDEVAEDPKDDSLDEYAEDELTEEKQPVTGSDAYEEDRLGTDENTDLTSYQYYTGSVTGGMDVPDWNNPSNVNAEGTVVAVIDSGVDYEHPDFKDVMWDRGEEYPTLVEMGGGKYGYCGVENLQPSDKYDSRDPMDDNGHGTHCAGVIGAAWDGKGVSGIANGVRIMAVKCGDSTGALYDSDVVKGFEYVFAAKEAGVPLVAVNCSFGAPDLGFTYRIMSIKAESAGINVVWASGNSSDNIDVTQCTSAYFYKVPGAIVVNSCGVTGRKSGFSCYGIRSTDVFAPGEEILSTFFPGERIRGVSRFKDDAVFFKDGSTPAFDDFEDEAVFFKPQLSEGSTFDMSVVKDTAIDGNPDDHVFKMEIPAASAEENTGELILDLGDEFSEQKPAFFYCDGNSLGSDTVLSIKVPLKDGGEKNLSMNFYQDVWYPRVVEFPENTDYGNLKLTMTVDDCDCDRVLYLAKAGLTSSILRHAFLDGTSMSAPAVTAAVAIAAARFETAHESDPEIAAERAARVIGSVSANLALKDYCRSGGMVKVSRLLDENYMPVVEDAENDMSTMTIRGYFFGDENGSVSLDGEDCEVIYWSDRAVTVSMPFVPVHTEVKAEIRTSDDRYGMRYVAMTPGEGNYIDRIPLDFMDNPADYYYEMLFATGEAVYFNVYKNGMDDYWKYIPGEKKWMQISDAFSRMGTESISSYAVYGDYVFYTYYGDIYLYDRRQEKLMGIIPLEIFPKNPFMGIVNAGSNIFVFTLSEMDENGEENPSDKTEVYKLTPGRLSEKEVTVTKVGVLSDLYDYPRVAADNEGNMYVTDGNKVEKVVFDPAKVQITSTVLCENLFEQKPDTPNFDIAAVKDGILFFNGAARGTGDRVENDIFLMKYDGTLTACTEKYASSPTTANNVLAYRDKVYFLAVDRYKEAFFELGVMDKATNEVNEDKHSGGEYDVPDVPDDNVDDIKLEIAGKTYYLSTSVSVYYTAAKHVLYNSKSKGSHDLKLELKGFDPKKYALKGISIKNSKKATHTPSGNLIAADNKRACMIPRLKAVKGVKLTDEEKAHLKAVNDYFKKNPVYFSILQRDISDAALGSIEVTYNKTGTKLKKLVYKPKNCEGFTLPKKDYTVEFKDPTNAKAGITVRAKEGGNLWGTKEL